jgi:hypothetical protein
MGALQLMAMWFSHRGKPVYIQEFFSVGASTQGSFDVYFFFGEETGPELPICSKP